MTITKRVFKYISGYYTNLDAHKKEIASKGVLALILKLLAAVLGLGVNFLLARMLNADGMGIYFLASTISIVAGTLATFGLDNTLLRFTATLVERGDWSALKGVYEKGTSIVLISAILTMGVLYLLAPWLTESVFSKPELLIPLRLMSLSIVPFAFSNIFAELLKGLRNIFAASVVQGVEIPALMLVGLSLLIVKSKLNVDAAVIVYVLATAGTGITGYIVWKNSVPLIKSTVGKFETCAIFQSSLPLFWVTVSNLLLSWSATFFLGVWATNADVGVYGVASRIAMRIAFIPVAVSSIAAPKFATAFSSGNMQELESLAKGASKIMMFFALPPLLVLLLFPGQIMGLFGKDFANGGVVLFILAIGQSINVMAGLVKYLLMMSGYEKFLTINYTIVLFLNLLLGAIIIPQFGMLGAAISTTSVIVISNIILSVGVRFYLGFWASPFKI